MSPLTSMCRICGNPKPTNEFALNECSNCAEHGRVAGAAFAAANPEASQDQILYAERMAKQARAHMSRKNYVDPRTFSASTGMIPQPPQPGGRQ
jgi:hypothetical protein